MTQENLSPEARYRLWQCYALLLQLAENAEQTDTDTLSPTNSSINLPSDVSVKELEIAKLVGDE
ncbi:MAG: hypothetical protein AAF629_30215 [Chloroflexota bacterium]